MPFLHCEKYCLKISSFTSHFSRNYSSLSSAVVNDRHKCVSDAAAINDTSCAGICNDNMSMTDAIMPLMSDEPMSWD